MMHMRCYQRQITVASHNAMRTEKEKQIKINYSVILVWRDLISDNTLQCITERVLEKY